MVLFQTQKGEKVDTDVALMWQSVCDSVYSILPNGDLLCTLYLPGLIPTDGVGVKSAVA